jgi:hypothetical protein
MLNLITVVRWIMLDGSAVDYVESGDEISSIHDQRLDQKTLDKLSKLELQFSRTVDELQKRIPRASDKSVRSDSLSRFFATQKCS